MRFFTQLSSLPASRQLLCLMLYVVGLATITLGPVALNAVVGASHDLVIIYEYGKNEYSSLTLNQPFTEPDRPEGIGAAANTLLTALYQKVPVLVPLPLWQIIVDHKELFSKICGAQSTESVYRNLKDHKLFNTQAACNSFYKRFSYINKLYKKLCSHVARSKDSLELKQALQADILFDKAQCPADLQYASDSAWFELSHYLLCASIPLDDFIVKQVALASHPQHSFLLFLPRNYYANMQQTGMALEKYKTVPDAYSLKAPGLSKQELERYDTIFIDILRELFISKAALEKNNKHAAIRWNIYCMGHGIYSESAHDTIEKERKSLSNRQNSLKKLESYKAQAYVQEIKEHKKAITGHKKRIDSLNKNNLICGMPLKTFTNFLVFLEQEIPTALLYYSSCSSGGKHFIDAFTLDTQLDTEAHAKNNSTQENSQLLLSYTVLADTLAEAPSSSANPLLRLGYYTDRATQREFPVELADIINWDAKNQAVTHNNKLKIERLVTPFLIDTIYYFNDFFACAHTTKPTLEGVKKLIASLSPVHQRIDSTSCFKNKNPERLENCPVSYEVVNLPSIRLPGQSRFFCIDDEGSKLIACSAQKQENSQKNIQHGSDPILVTGDTQALLLYTPEIEKIIYTSTETNTTSMGYGLGQKSGPDDTEVFPAIVSMIPGKAYHTIDEIYAPTVPFSTLIKQNFPFYKLYTSKLVHIKKLTCINDCPALKKTGVQVFYDVMLANRDKSTSSSHKVGRNKLFFTLTPSNNLIDKKRRWYGTSWSANREIPTTIIKKVNSIPQGERQVTKLKNYFSDANTLDDYRVHRSITSSEIVRALCAPLTTVKAVKDIFKSFIPKS